MARQRRSRLHAGNRRVGISLLLARLLTRLEGWVWRNVRGLSRAVKRWIDRQQSWASQAYRVAPASNFLFEALEPRVLLSADLGGGITSFTPANGVPGSSATATVQLLKLGSDALGDSVRVKIFASPDGTLDNTDKLVGQVDVSASAFTDNVPLQVNFALDTAAVDKPGTYRLISSIDPQNTIPESDETNNISVAAGSLQLSNTFGEVGGDSIPSLTLTDSDGTRFTLTITGKGTVVVNQDANAYLLQITGSDANTQLALTASGGDGRVSLGAITVAGAMQAINAAAADLKGNLNVAGALGSLVLGDARAAQITTTGSGKLDISARVFDGVKVNTTQVVNTLKLSAWNAPAPGSSSLQAAGLGSALVIQGFAADMLLSGVGAGPLVLGSFSVGGAVGASQWNIGGRASSITVGSLDAGWHANIKGVLTQLSVQRDASGLLAVRALQVLQINGSALNFTVLVGADLGSDAALGGTGTAADTFGISTLARIRIAGNVTGGVIAVGVNPVNGRFNDGDDVMLGSPINRVQEFYVGGQLDPNSRIVAPAFPATAWINGQTVNTASLPQLRTQVVDLTAPVLTASLANDTGSSNSDGLTSNPTITGTALDLKGATVLLGTLDPGPGVLPNLNLSVSLLANGSFTISAAQLAAIAGGTLAQGAHTLRLAAADAAGNISAPVDVSFVFDSLAPSAAAFDLAAASDTGTQGDHMTTASVVTLAGQSAPSTLVRLLGIDVSTQTDANGFFSFSGVALALGANPFTIELTDAAGNSAQSSVTVTREASVVDSQAPVLSAILSGDTGTSATDKRTNNPVISGSASDNVQVVQLLAILDPAQAGVANLDITSLLQADGSFTVTASRLAILAGGTLIDGAHVLRMVAVDVAGNKSSPVDVNFVLDTSAPPLASFAFSNADASDATGTQTAAARAQINGQAEEGATITLAGKSISTVAGAGGFFVLPNVELSLGNNLITLTATDAAGNTQTLSRTLTRVAQTQADAVLVWNDIALRAIQRDATYPEVATRTLAMLSLAQYDALATIEGSPAYLVKLSVTGPVDAQVAAAVAAHRILSLTYPAQKDILDAALVSYLGTFSDGAAKDTGIALGLSVANAVWAARQGDGSDAFILYTGNQALGQWRPTGPMFDVAEEPQWKNVTPFALASPDKFRPGPPPALDTAAYADAVNEVKQLGVATGSTRTADQTQQAQFWADGKGSYTPPGHWNQIASQVATTKGNSLSSNARLFAQLNVALADAAIACWDSKYTYGNWRPVTAIQNADADGNAATVADGNWTSLLISPSHPEYVSGHSTLSGAAAAVLAAAFGENTSFTATSVTLPGITRSFINFSQAEDEAGRSRVYGGIHFEFSNVAGKALGQQIGAAVLARFALTQDTLAPTVSVTATPASTKTNLTITGQVLDNLSGVTAAQYRIDNGPLQTLALGANGSFSIVTTLPLDGSAEGSHTVSVLAVDAAGNQNTGVLVSFVLDTVAPVLTLNSLANGDTLSATTRLSGSANSTGTALTLLNYSFDGGSTRSLVFDASSGAFDTALNFGALDVGSHLLLLKTQDAAGNSTILSRTVLVNELAPFNITKVNPVDGTNQVGVTQRPLVNFSRAVNLTTLNQNSFFATGPGGTKLAATIVPAADGSFAWLFFDQPMPGGAQITLHVDGSRIRAAADGAFLDADGNASAGGELTISFTTVSTTSVAGTKIVGKVVDPGPDFEPMTFDDIQRGPDGVIHTPDDVFLLPIAHAKVYILGQENRFVFTDVNGNFELDDVPAGTVKLAIDGRTATNAPSGVFFPEMVMDAELKAGLTNTVMGSMGSDQERRANTDRREVYLPRVPTDVLQPVSNAQPTVINIVNAKAAPDLTPEQRAELTLTIKPGSAVDVNGQPVQNVQIGIATVPPQLVRDMLPPGVLQHTFDITIQAPGVAIFIEPVKITFPNVFNAAPGTKLSLLSFDHTTGMLVINGTGTVSANGLTVISDEGSGVRAPGWHGMAPPGPTGNKDKPRGPNPGPGPGPNPPPPPGPGPGGGGGGVVPPPPPPIIIILEPPPPIVVVVVVPPPPIVVVPPPPVVVVVPGTPAGPNFHIDLQLPAAGLTPVQRQAVRDAAARWEQVIVGDLPADWTVDGLVDDLRIRFNVGVIDGSGGTLAKTQLLDVRTGAIKLPSLASITLDSADLAGLSPSQLQAVLMHEIGHALGIGDLWASLGLVNNSNAADPRFTGSNAAAEFAALTGVAQSSVPIDNRTGANATHWREAIFGNELMTPLLDANGPYPLSALTLASLKDMGYIVNLGAADPYTLPGPGFVFHPNATAPANSGNGQLLDATGGGVTPVQVQAAPAPDSSEHLFFAFDFGPPSSAVEPGFAGVSSTTVYNATRGWGWQAGSQVIDKQTGTNPLARLTGSFAQTHDATFIVDLPNGTYDVIVDMGDDAAAHEGVTYSIEGVRRGAISTLAGQHTGVTHRLEVIDGQMNLHFIGTGAPVALNGLEIHQVSTYVTPVSSADYTSGTFFLAIENLATGFILRDKVEVTSGAALCINGVVLSPNTAYRQYVYQVETNTVGVSEFVTPSSGVAFDMPEIPLGNRISGDTDGDGLENAAEFIIGTRADKADTDGDGISDRAELLQNLDPLGGKSLPNGVIASQTVLGNAVALDVVSDPSNAAKLTAFVATGSRGLAVIDVSRYTTPIVLADLDLPGNAQDVAVDSQRQRALVAAGDAGLLILDVSNLAAPKVLFTIAFDGNVLHVEVRDGLAFVAYGGSLAVVDVNTGEIRQTVNTGSSSTTALAIEGDALYTIGDGSALRAYSVTGGVLAAGGILALPSAGRSLFVGNGVAYIGAESAFLGGFMTVNVANVASLSLLSAVDNAGIAGRAVALNGSGLGVVVGTPGGVFNNKVLDVVRTGDPANTGDFVARYPLPAAPEAVQIAGGMAYVAAGSAGLVVVNYAGFDGLGIAPTVSITADAVDVDPAKPGIQVIEGRSVRVRPTVTDDVQIRSLELLVNGNVVGSDNNFPYELFAQAPVLPSSVSFGTMTVQVRATDTGGNVTLSDILSLDVVPDTFPPQLGSINIDEGARRFFVRSIDLTFNEPLNSTLLSTSGISLLRDGGDGIFGNAGDVAVPVTLDARSGGQALSIVLGGILPAGNYRLVVDPSILADRAGNNFAGAIVRNFSIRPASDVHAISGVPDIPTAPSANPGQQIGIAVPFDPSTARAEFKVIDASGDVSTRVVNVFRVDAAHGIAFFNVPIDASSGDAVVYSQVGNVRTDFPDGTFPVQILPTITDVQVESVAADGSTAQLLIAGTGFVEGGGSQYRFGSETISDALTNGGPDVFGRSDVVLGYVVNGYVRVTVPLSAGVFGSISVKTAGGASAAYSVSVSAIGAVALSGTPADGAQASANAGQSVTLSGVGLNTTTDVLLRFVDTNGAVQMVKLSPSTAAADGSSATLIVPQYANGAFTVQVFGAAEQRLLQIVPTLTGIDVQDRTVLFGSGFVEGAGSYSFAGVSVSDSAGVGNDIDVYYDQASQNQNGSAYINRTALPVHGLGNVSVSTAGGTSAPLSLNTVRVNVASTSLGDVAVDAVGKLWVSDQGNPGHLLKIDPGTGQVLQTITMNADFGTPSPANYAGLQVLGAKMTLGGTVVPVGSLLVFNGNPGPDRVVAVDLATGAVIASLTLDANYDLTGATFDAQSNRIFLTENNGPGNRIVAINAATGMQTGVSTAPFNIQSWSGLAIDPTTGHLWLGAFNGGGQLVEYQVSGAGVLSELRRLDLASQRVNNNEISGLSFAADGSLWVSSTQGEIYKINTA